ncbi:MAG: protein phosphatase 2C domain-containing protein [Acidobacteria bacterium]|nr:protein phosphatase 2C domain-containing protein [Acidobacteriota bacterium]
MEKLPVDIPTLSDEGIANLMPANMVYPGLSRLFGHLAPNYVKYIATAMDSYTWFRYVESESKSFILKNLATRALYKMLNRQDRSHICAGNENGIVHGERAVGLTSRGVNYKAINEDGFGIFDEGEVLKLVVCDGVGDCLVGEVASFVILDQFNRYPEKSLHQVLLDSCHQLVQLAKDLAVEIPEFVTFPNEISQAAVTALRIEGDQCQVAQVGDVILYTYREGNLTMLDPHGDWLNLRQMTDLFANEKYLSQRHIINNAVGRNYDSDWQAQDFALRSGDVLVLASDGLETLHPKTVLELLSSSLPSKQKLNELYQEVIRANLNWQTPGSPIYTKPDNVTLVVYQHP